MVLALARNVSKTHILPNRKPISKELLGVIHEHNMKSNLAMIKKEANTFGLLFLGDDATISIFPFLNIMDTGGNIPVSVWGFVNFQDHLADGKNNMEHSFVINF